MITFFSFALLLVGVFPVTYLTLGAHHVGPCDPTPFLAGLWLLALTSLGSFVGFVSILVARKKGCSVKLSAAVTILNILCFAVPILYLFCAVTMAHPQ